MTAIAHEQKLFAGAYLQHSENFVRLRFEQPRQSLSSAVLNGGSVLAQQFINLKVSSEYALPDEDPADTLQKFCAANHWPGTTVGMMTAASMNSLRVRCEHIDDVPLAILVTTGLGNARRAGDRAEYRQLACQPQKVGTINLAICLEAPLRPEAMVELITVATEAKAAALQQAEVISPVSRALATGTGTDAVALFCSLQSDQSNPIRFAGKHTLLGERVGCLVIDAIVDSLQFTDSEKREY
ncbi:adenosylcobinamide amidohydrolase [Porticoccus sp. W117]|uniref:adenosylcobinamide amidohydrolase n=1 Tax=Porticoccus sp. W117 TaxID=3054777 RepID=UPI00259631E1|nr:adenosylcobinamide amidohydrolase [Porticoccus sp. W117]MDM3871419.1 adenosylcobinamide amidohydrolase [Porticoccus sp. W117]